MPNANILAPCDDIMTSPSSQADLSSVGLLNAEVIRSDPTELCEAGLCPNGPQAAWGRTWSITVVSNVSIVTATSPLCDNPTINDTLPLSVPFMHSYNVVSSVAGAAAVRSSPSRAP